MVDQNNDVSTPIKAQRVMVDKAAPVRTLVAGTKKMREAREIYLPREPAEEQSAYENRVKRTVLFNATGKTVDDMTGKVFVKPVVLKDDVAAQLKTWAENFDNAGRHINVFACDTFRDSLQPGIGYIFVDAPPPPVREDKAPPTVADYQTAKWRPYCTFIPVENLLGWKTTTIEGAVKLTQIRIRECITEASGEYGEKEVDQIRVVSVNGLGTGCIWQTFQKPAGSETWQEIASGSISLPEIPLVPVYINRTNFMMGEPPLAKLAELNITHWQSSSDQRNILHVARVPILFGAGFTENDKLSIGASEMVRSSDPNAKLSYVEHTGAAIGSGDKDLQNLEDQMESMGMQAMVKVAGPKTATGEIRDDVKENSPLAMMATALEDALESALEFMGQFASLPAGSGGSVIVNKEFGVASDLGTWMAITQAYVGGKLDLETYINEGKRRGIFAEDVDPDVVKDRLQTEAPLLGPNVPPGSGMPLNDDVPPKKPAVAGAAA